jgi:hypothetical protein
VALIELTLYFEEESPVRLSCPAFFAIVEQLSALTWGRIEHFSVSKRADYPKSIYPSSLQDFLAPELVSNFVLHGRPTAEVIKSMSGRSEDQWKTYLEALKRVRTKQLDCTKVADSDAPSPSAFLVRMLTPTARLKLETCCAANQIVSLDRGSRLRYNVLSVGRQMAHAPCCVLMRTCWRASEYLISVKSWKEESYFAC